MVPFAVDPGRTALVIVDMQNVYVADSPVAGGVINDGAPLAALHSLVDVRPDDIIVGKPRVRQLLRHRPGGAPALARHRHDHPRWHQHQRVRGHHRPRGPLCTSSGTLAALAAGRRGVLAVVQERDGSSAGMGWHLMPGVEQRALPWAVPRHKTEPGNSPGRSMCWLATGRPDDAVTVAARSDRRGQVAPGQGGQDAEEHR